MRGMGAVKPFGLRMPAEIRNWIAKRAEMNGRSQNSEILTLLRAEKGRESLEQQYIEKDLDSVGALSRS